MKSVSELTDFYYKNLFPTLQKLENDRKNLRYKIIVTALVYTILCAAIAYALGNFY